MSARCVLAKLDGLDTTFSDIGFRKRQERPIAISIFPPADLAGTLFPKQGFWCRRKNRGAMAFVFA